MVAARNLPEDIVWASLRLARSRGDIFAPGEGGPEVAQKVSVTFACDYDQKEIPVGQHRTRRFGLDGRDYEIDLCAKHSQKLDEVVNRYAEHARGHRRARDVPNGGRRRTVSTVL